MDILSTFRRVASRICAGRADLASVAVIKKLTASQQGLLIFKVDKFALRPNMGKSFKCSRARRIADKNARGL